MSASARLGNGGGVGAPWKRAAKRAANLSRETSREREPRKRAAKRGANSRREIEARNEPPVVPTEVAPRSPPGRRVGARRLLSSRPFAPQNLRHFEGRSDSLGLRRLEAFQSVVRGRERAQRGDRAILRVIRRPTTDDSMPSFGVFRGKGTAALGRRFHLPLSESLPPGLSFLPENLPSL